MNEAGKCCKRQDAGRKIANIEVLYDVTFEATSAQVRRAPTVHQTAANARTCINMWISERQSAIMAGSSGEGRLEITGLFQCRSTEILSTARGRNCPPPCVARGRHRDAGTRGSSRLASGGRGYRGPLRSLLRPDNLRSAPTGILLDSTDTPASLPSKATDGQCGIPGRDQVILPHREQGWAGLLKVSRFAGADDSPLHRVPR